jgi:hypothetical protein
MSRCLGTFIVGIAATMAAGCGGSSPSVPPQGTTVAVTFGGVATPQAVATQSGDGPFVAASLQGGNQLFLTLPSGTTKYGIAYVCSAFNDEFVFEATTQDATVLTLSCPSAASLTLGAATGSVDASAITGATNVFVRGSGGGGSLGGVAEPFSVSMQDGVNDVAFIATDSNGKALGVKIARGQNIPGAVNGGSTVLFGTGDATTTQPVTINNVPAGFPVPDGVFAQYHTVNGTSFPLLLSLGFNSPLPGTYPAVPAGATQSGDFYLYQSNTLNAPAGNQQVGTTLTTTSGGGPLTMTLPAPWSYAGPTPAKFPTFTFDYSSFSAQPAVSQQVLLTWPVGTSRNLMQVMATANFQSGAKTLTVPDLSALNGFFPPAASGAQVSWIADIFGGTMHQFIFSVNPPANGSFSFVENRGSYIQP